MGGKNSTLKEERKETVGDQSVDQREETNQKTVNSTSNEEGFKPPVKGQSLSSVQLKMKEHQINLFRDIQLPAISWLKRRELPLEELFVEPTMFNVTKETKADDSVVKMDEIFNDINGRAPRRIKLEGNPGCGKTTVALKILSDWSRGEPYLKDHFDLAFGIPMRNHEGDIYSRLIQQCEINEGDKEKRKALEELRGRVLLLFDGLDEASEEARRNLLDVLRGTGLSNETVLVTCRNSSSDSKSESATSEEFGDNSFWDKRILIRGLSVENKKEFIGKYLSNDFSRVEKLVTNSSLPLLELCECSLLLLLLAALLAEKEIESVSTWTTLFKTLLNFIIEKVLEKEHSEEVNEESDIFKSETQNALILQNAFVQFGKLALGKIKRKSLIIDKREISELSAADDSIQKLGFLSESVSFLKCEGEEHYKPIHKSFMEFSAAFYLSTLNETELEKEVSSLADVQLLPHGDLFLYTFLAGFLQNEAHKLFKAFLPWKSLITIFKRGFCRILLELPSTGDILRSLTSFTPKRWPEFPLSASTGQWFSSVIKHREPEQPLENLRLKLPSNVKESLTSLPETLNVNEITLDVRKMNEKNNESLEALKGKSFRCRNLSISVNPNVFQDFNSFLEIFSIFKTEQLCLTLTYSKSASDVDEETDRSQFLAFYNELTEGNLKNTIIHHLSFIDIHPVIFNSIFPYVKHLIEAKRIENGITVTIFSYSRENLGDSLDCLEQFFSVVCTSSHLTNFVFDHSVHTPLDTVPHFSLNEKHWNYICMSGNYRQEAAAILQPFPVEEFDCLGRYRTHEYVATKTKILSSCQGVKRLIGSDIFIQNISKEFPSTWKGFETIERIDLFVVEDLNSSWFSNFKSLRHLFLSFYSFFLVDHDGDVLFELITSLPSLKSITVDNECVDDVGIFIRFLEKLSNVSNGKQNLQIRLDNVDVSLPLAVEPLNSFCTSVEKCLLKDILREFSFRRAVDPLNITNHPIIDYFLSKPNFKISTEFCDPSGLNVIPFLYEESGGKNYERICVALSQDVSTAEQFD